jgi:MFS family permease
MVAGGAALMAVGQASLAVTHSLPVAIGARVLVGAGDAMTFISVLHVVAMWFAPRRVPVMTQLTGIVGQTGQILSAIPLVALLHGPGWTPAFLSAAALSVGACVLAIAFLGRTPARPAGSEPEPTVRAVRTSLRSAWRHPGTRLGLWTHFSSQFSGTVFVLLWGFPFMVRGEGLTRQQAGALLTVFVLAGMAAAPFLGVLVSRHPMRRSWLVLGIIALTAGTWTVLLALPHRAPLWLLVVLVLVLALGGPGSMIGFDFARTFNPPNRLGTATGIVNVGGFVASLLTILAVGVALDLVRPDGNYDLVAFRVALSTQYVFWAVGVVGIVLTRRKVRARLAREGVHVRPVREVLRRGR